MWRQDLWWASLFAPCKFELVYKHHKVRYLPEHAHVYTAPYGDEYTVALFAVCPLSMCGGSLQSNSINMRRNNSFQSPSFNS